MFHANSDRVYLWKSNCPELYHLQCWDKNGCPWGTPSEWKVISSMHDYTVVIRVEDQDAVQNLHVRDAPTHVF